MKALLLFFIFLTSALSEIIIIGAGTSGCALASKLCRRLPDTPITLFERAPPRNPLPEFHVRSPRMMYRAWFNPDVTETFSTVKSSGVPIDPVAFTGDTLGGSSAMNGMQWSVPLNGTIQRWGIKGLTPKQARRFYKKAFRRLRPTVRKRFLQTYVDQYMEAAEKAGFAPKGPFGLGDEDAIWKNLLAIDKKGRRRDSCTAYLKSAFKRCGKFKLTQGARVTKVLLRERKDGLRAIGVKYQATDGTVKVLRGKEIVLSAGPYESPKLLQLSGIGPKDVLQNAGVRIRHKLPVGMRTVGRPGGIVISAYTGVPLDPVNNGTIVNSTVARTQWENGRGGVLGIGVYSFNGRLKNTDGYFAAGMALGPNIGLDSPHVWSICLTNGLSEGHVRITSSDAKDAMKIQFNLLKRGDDFRRMRRCMKRMGDIHDNFPPEFGMVDLMPTDNSEIQVRSSSRFAGHFVGGCRVGEVVDDELKVMGIRGLRVVDSSVFNSLPVSAGPMASVYMLAEFMAKKIAEEKRA